MTTITVPTPPEFRFPATLLSHGWLELAPFGHDDAYTTLERIQQLSDGAVVKLTVRAAENHDLLVVVEGLRRTPSNKRQGEITATVACCFNLDFDLSSFYGLIDGDERYSWVVESGAGRMLRSPTVWEDLAKTLMTTNTTWNMTKQMVSRINTLGEPFRDGLHAFPTPERIVAMNLDALAEHVRAGYRNAYLHELATTIAEGRVDVEAWAQSDLTSKELFKAVTALKGFGPYAAGTVLKLLGRFDELALDSVARSMYAREFNRGEKAPDSAIEAHYSPFGEWQGLAIWMDVMRRWFIDGQ